LTLATESSSLSIPTAVSIPPKIWTSALKPHRQISRPPRSFDAMETATTEGAAD
jgi:hypothetical protein